jgi:hypothetical protein
VIYDSFGAFNTPKILLRPADERAGSPCSSSIRSTRCRKAPGWSITVITASCWSSMGTRPSSAASISATSILPDRSPGARQGHRKHCGLARYRPADRRPGGRRIAEAVHRNLGQAARQTARRKAYFPALKSRERTSCVPSAARRMPLQPDLPDADLGDRQRRKAGAPDQCLLRSRSPVAEALGDAASAASMSS